MKWTWKGNTAAIQSCYWSDTVTYSVGAESKSALGKTGQCGISNFREWRKPRQTKDRCMIKAQESLLLEMRSFQWTQFRQRQRLWEVFLGRWNPAVIPVTFSSISPRCVWFGRGFLHLSGAYQLILTLMLMAVEDSERFGSFTEIWCYLLLVLPFALAIAPSWVKQVSGDQFKKPFHGDASTFWEGSWGWEGKIRLQKTMSQMPSDACRLCCMAFS